jgi:hypothetical protein
MKTYLEDCPCGSGQEADAEFDARGIFLAYVCPKCRKEKLSRYRSDVLTDPGYYCDEPIEPEE